MPLAHDSTGTGPPLLLLHGVGSFRRAWDPVVPLLAREREVLAVDLPGFGDSPALAPPSVPAPEVLAEVVAGLLDELGIESADVAGNSLGGWIALELAKAGRARSVCALSPAGFWSARERAYCTASVRAAARTARLAEPRVDGLARSAVVRTLASAQLVLKGWRQEPAAYAAALRNLTTSPGLEATLAAMDARHFSGGDGVPPPVTIAWAAQDRLLPPHQAERARRAIPHARVLTLRRCGHVPMTDDPEQVAETILLASEMPVA